MSELLLNDCVYISFGLYFVEIPCMKWNHFGHIQTIVMLRLINLYDMNS